MDLNKLESDSDRFTKSTCQLGLESSLLTNSKEHESTTIKQLKYKHMFVLVAVVGLM